MFGRATITLGVGPHSSFIFFPSTNFFDVPERTFGETLPHDAVCTEIVCLL